MENNDTLALNHIRDLSAELLLKVMPEYKAFILGHYHPEPDVMAYMAHHKEVAHLNYLCRAILKRGGKLGIIEDLIQLYTVMHETETMEEIIRQTIGRFYRMLKDTAYTMDAWSTILTAWPLLHHFLKAYTKQIEDNTTLDFN